MLLFLIVMATTTAEITTLTKKVGETFVIELPSNPTTGYQWYMNPIESNAPKICDLVSQKYQSDTKQSNSALFRKVGGGGKQVFTMKAKEKGTSNYEFVYKRSWENTNPAPTIYQIIVE
ncbi:putative inhibitor of cysteine peptidase [Blattamonas nauphoetae]|uniref:Inhibitor of cysteine peptidase n=1 Tax=Blattamonas nauphoetae TaxID=2049346 RepID=A0ABQ9YF11_9EUKA|nr:putative inhibitor of cysteine peptidase [Blattamonas nauphoetae]